MCWHWEPLVIRHRCSSTAAPIFHRTISKCFLRDLITSFSAVSWKPRKSVVLRIFYSLYIGLWEDGLKWISAKEREKERERNRRQSSHENRAICEACGEPGFPLKRSSVNKLSGASRENVHRLAATTNEPALEFSSVCRSQSRNFVARVLKYPK